MFVQVAAYALGRGTLAELESRVDSGPAEVMKTVPGFVDYMAFHAGDRIVASVSVFEDEDGLREAENRLEEWVTETMEIFEISPVSLTEGPVFAKSSHR